MNKCRFPYLRLKDLRMSYQRSRKYITMMKTLDSCKTCKSHSEIDQKILGQRLCHPDSLNCSRTYSSFKNTVTNSQVLNVNQPAIKLKELREKCHRLEDIYDNVVNTGVGFKSDNTLFHRLFWNMKRNSCKSLCLMPSHNKIWKSSKQYYAYRSKCLLRQMLSRNNCSRHYSTSAGIVSDFGVRQEPPWRVLFFGTDQISVETLKRLHENMYSTSTVVESLEVVSNVEKREVRAYAEEQNLKVYDWPVPTMPNKYDVGVLVSFGHLIPDRIIHMFPYGILNMHPSLLPRWRGASPIIHTILNGDTETGISVMEIRPKRFDVGPVLMQQRVPVPSRCTSLQLSNILAPLGADMVIEALADLRNLERDEEEQNTKGITYAHKLHSWNANIDWENQTCTEIDQQFRAISEMMPLKSRWKDKVAKFYDIVDPSLLAHSIDLSITRGYAGDITVAEPGTPVYYYKLDCLLIKCKARHIESRDFSRVGRITHAVVCLHHLLLYVGNIGTNGITNGTIGKTLNGICLPMVPFLPLERTTNARNNTIQDGVVGFRHLNVKKRMTAMEFMCGYLTPPDGSIFESLPNELNKHVKKKWVKQRVKA